jgi:hypothetical protein
MRIGARSVHSDRAPVLLTNVGWQAMPVDHGPDDMPS